MPSPSQLARRPKRTRQQCLSSGGGGASADNNNNNNNNTNNKRMKRIQDAAHHEDIPDLVLGLDGKNEFALVEASIKKLATLLDLENEDQAIHPQTNGNEAFRVEAHVHILEVLKTHTHSLEVQICGWKCLKNPAYKSDAARVTLANLGVAAAAVRSSKLFPQSEELQEDILETLWQLYYNSVTDGKAIKESWRRFVYYLNGVDMIVAATKQFSHNNFLMELGVRLLFKICQMYPDLREGMVQAGVMEAISVAVRKHREDPELKEWVKELWNVLL